MNLKYRLSKILPILSVAVLCLITGLPVSAQSSGKAKSKSKKATVYTGTATVVSDDDTGDSAPKLISTTGGNGTAASSSPWANFEALKKAATEKNPAACYELGERYLRGTPDTPQSVPQALIYLEDAARLDNADANFRLGKLYADGVETPQDYPKALRHYTAAARAGHATAQHNLGAMYASGRGTRRDYAEGLAWLIIAARTNQDAIESEKKLRDYLEKYPKTIATGEARAAAITQELTAPPPAPTPAPSAKPKPVMDSPPPKIEITPLAPLSSGTQ